MNGTAARFLAEGVVDTVREPLLVLYEDLRITSADRAVYDAFKVRRAEAETEGRSVCELRNGPWDIPV